MTVSRHPCCRMAGQAMTEYVLVLGLAVLVLVGPGLDLLREELPRVVKANDAGYSYAISLSQLPVYGTGAAWRAAMVAEGIDSATIDALGKDPLEDAMLEQLAGYLSARNDITGALNDHAGVDINDIWDEAEGSALQFFGF